MMNFELYNPTRLIFGVGSLEKLGKVVGQYGTNVPYPVLVIEQTLSGLYDIPHRAGLAVINPAWMRFVLELRCAENRKLPGRLSPSR